MVARVVAVAILLVACGGSKPAELRTHTVSAAIVDACRASAAVLCDRAAECAPDYVPFFYLTRDKCIDEVAEKCAYRYEGPGASATPAVCGAAANAPCSVLADPEEAEISGATNRLLESCEVSGGTRPLGQSCLRDGDCTSGWCKGAGKLACGHCGLSANDGEACSDDARCRAGMRCILGRCVVTRDEGASCTRNEECTTLCRDGYCARLGALGDRCVELGCDLTHRYACGEPEKICGEVSIAAPGEACDPLGQARPGKRYCDVRGFCGAAQVCDRVGTFDEACGGAGDPPCQAALECVGGRCRSKHGPDRCE